MIRLPGTFFLVLAEAHGVLTRPAKGGTICISGEPAADGDKYQANGPADRCIRPIAWSEHTGIAIDVELLANGTIHEKSRTDITGGRLNSVEVKTWLAHRLNSSDDNRQIFRQTARHNGIDRNFLNSRRRPLWWDRADNFLRIAIGSIEHSLNALRRRRHDGQSITQLLPAKPVVDSFQTIFNFNDVGG